MRDALAERGITVAATADERGDDDNAIEAAEDAVLAAEDRLAEVSRRLGVSDADIAEAVEGGEANPGTPDGVAPDSGVRRSVARPAPTAAPKAYYDVPFGDSLSAVVAPGSTVRENVFVRDTPQVFRDIGMAALPIMASPRHLRLNYHDRAGFTRDFGAIRQGEHAHGLGNAIRYLPKALEHPLAIVANFTPNATPGSVVALTDLTVRGKRVVVPVLIESQVQADGDAVDAHLVLTVYDSSDWVGQFVNPAVAAEKAKGVGVFYLDQKRTGHINALRGLVKGVAASGVLHRIDDPGSPVKGAHLRFRPPPFSLISPSVSLPGEDQAGRSMAYSSSPFMYHT